VSQWSSRGGRPLVSRHWQLPSGGGEAATAAAPRRRLLAWRWRNQASQRDRSKNPRDAVREGDCDGGETGQTLT